MTGWRRWLERPWWLAALAATFVWIGNLGGPAVGDDGVGYAAIADSLKAGNGLGYFLERELTTWPPGWPALMALVSRITGVSTEMAGGILNGIAAGVLVLLVHRYLGHVVTTTWVRMTTTALVALGATTQLLGHLLMTDLGFAAATFGVFNLVLTSRTERPWKGVIGAAAVVWVAFSFRYVGVVIIATVGLWLLVGRTPWRRRLQLAAAFGVVASLFPVAWMARNRSIDGTLLGVRWSSARGPLQNLFDIGATYGNFSLPGVLLYQKTLWFAVALGAGALVVAFTWRVLGHDPRVRSLGGVRDLLATPVGLLVIQVVLYTLYLWYVRSTTALNQIDYRLLNPVFVPLLLLLAGVVDRLVRRAATADAAPGDRTWGRLARASFCGWAAVSILVGLAMVPYFAGEPRLFDGNYASDEFAAVRDNPALDRLPPDCQTVSNLPNALYPAVDSRWSPGRTGPESDQAVDDLPRLQADVRAGGDHCLVWVDLPPPYGHLIPLDELRRDFDMQPLGDSGPVKVFRLAPA